MPFYLLPFSVPSLPGLTQLHKIVIHFSITILILAWLADLACLIKKTAIISKAPDQMFNLGYVLLALTYVTGQIASQRKGISLGDSEWLEKNSELALQLVNHRGLGLLTLLIFTCIFIYRTKISGFEADRRLALNPIVALLMSIGVFFIVLTAHLGGNLSF